MTCSALAWDTAWLMSPCGFLLNGISGNGSSPRLSLHSFAVLLVAAWFSVPTGSRWVEVVLWVVSVSFGSATGKATGKAIKVVAGGWLESGEVSVGLLSPVCRDGASRGSQPFASERARTRRSVRWVS